MEAVGIVIQLFQGSSVPVFQCSREGKDKRQKTKVTSEDPYE